MTTSTRTKLAMTILSVAASAVNAGCAPSCTDVKNRGGDPSKEICTCDNAAFSDPSIPGCCHDPQVPQCAAPQMPATPAGCRSTDVRQSVLAAEIDVVNPRGTGDVDFCESFTVRWLYFSIYSATLKTPAELGLSPMLLVEQEPPIPSGEVLPGLPRMFPAPWSALKPCASEVKVQANDQIRNNREGQGSQGVFARLRGLPNGDSIPRRFIVGFFGDRCGPG
jgi:hypothetical protein